MALASPSHAGVGQEAVVDFRLFWRYFCWNFQRGFEGHNGLLSDANQAQWRLIHLVHFVEKLLVMT